MDYVKLVDYAAKDALLTGNPSKLVKGTELGAEFDALVTAVATKYDSTDLGVTVQAYAIPAGTACLFYANTAPTSWTKVTTAALDNCALRIVSDGSGSGGNGGVTGGTATFNACFGNSKSTGSYTLLVADIPSHNHGGATGGRSADHTHTAPAIGIQNVAAGGSASYSITGTGSTGAASADHTHTVSSQGGGGGHAHTINFDVRYASFILCTKDA